MIHPPSVGLLAFQSRLVLADIRLEDTAKLLKGICICEMVEELALRRHIAGFGIGWKVERHRHQEVAPRNGRGLHRSIPLFDFLILGIGTRVDDLGIFRALSPQLVVHHVVDVIQPLPIGLVDRVLLDKLRRRCTAELARQYVFHIAQNIFGIRTGKCNQVEELPPTRPPVARIDPHIHTCYCVEIMKGTIYRLECSISKKFYIGSTIHTLVYRLKKHRSTSKEPDKKGSPLYTHFTEVGWEVARIMPLYEVDFETRRDLLRIERDEIDKYLHDSLCLNHNRPIITPEEKKQMDAEQGKLYREKNREAGRNRVAEWRRNNPELRAEQVRRSLEQQRLKRMSLKNID